MLLVKFETPPRVAIAGSCSKEMRIHVEDTGGNRWMIGAPSVVNVSTPGTGVEVHELADCSDAAHASINVTSDRDGVSFYVRSAVVQDTTITVGVGPVTPASQAFRVAPMVRRGECTIPAGSPAIACPIDPPLNDRDRSFVIYQSTPSSQKPDDARVSCGLPSATDVHCLRIGTSGTVRVVWQVAEFTTGVKVHHLSTDCSTSASQGGNTVAMTIPIGVTVDPTHTFLLFNSVGGVPQSLDASSVRVVRFETAPGATTADDVVIVANSACGSDETFHRVQVVEMDAATVQHESLPAWMDSMLLQGTALTGAGATHAFSLHSWRPDPGFGSWSGGCIAVSGHVANNKASVTRAGTCTSQDEVIRDLRTQLVLLPSAFKVDANTFSFAAADIVKTSTDVPVVTDRSIFFTSGQWTGGQGWGQGGAAGRANAGVDSPMLQGTMGVIELAPGSAPGKVNVSVRRGMSGTSATFRVFAVELPQQP